MASEDEDSMMFGYEHPRFKQLSLNGRVFYRHRLISDDAMRCILNEQNREKTATEKKRLRHAEARRKYDKRFKGQKKAERTEITV